MTASEHPGRQLGVVNRPSSAFNMRLLSLIRGAIMDFITKAEGRVAPWNKGKLLGQKPH